MSEPIKKSTKSIILFGVSIFFYMLYRLGVGSASSTLLIICILTLFGYWYLIGALVSKNVAEKD